MTLNVASSAVGVGAPRLPLAFSVCVAPTRVLVPMTALAFAPLNLEIL